MSDLLYKIVIESETLNGELLFTDEKALLQVLKAIKADAFRRSEPKIVKHKWFGNKVTPTKNHPLKIEILKMNLHE